MPKLIFTCVAVTEIKKILVFKSVTRASAASHFVTL